MVLSSLLERFSEPETLKMAKLGRELRERGLDIVDLSLGEPDFDTPDHIKNAAKQAIDDNYSHYTPVPGYLDVRAAVCEKLKRDNGLIYKPDQIVVSTGAKQSIANLVFAVVDRGDEVIIPTPYWVTYGALVKLVGGIPLLVKTKMENGFKITPAELEENISLKTKMFMFSSPCNPSGAVYNAKELEALSEVLSKHPQICIMSDEIYEFINYVGKHESIAQFDSVKEQTVVVNGLSKGYAMTGWRVGYIAAPAPIAKACEKLQGQFTSATNSIAQRATIAALLGDINPSIEMKNAFAARKKVVIEKMKEIPNIECFEPDGAFYVFPVLKKYFGKKTPSGEVIHNADELCMYLLNEGHVSTVTGSAFGEPDCIRISFANKIENIEKGLQRLKTALASLS